jgi:hypothetical protein
MNQAVNFFWTILCFIPVITYWAIAGALLWCIIFIGISVASQLFPARLLQLSSNPKFYESLSIKFIRKFVQHGEYINRLTRKAKPNYRVVKDKANAVQYLKTVMMYERFHFLCFVFFSLTAIHAIVNSHYTLFTIIMIANVIYNMLQQYNRARIIRLVR